MNRLIATGALMVFAGTSLAHAGGMAEPVMEAEVVEAATAAASQEFIVPLLLLLVIIAALAAPDTAPLP